MSILIREVPLPDVWQLRHEVMYPELEATAVQLADDATGRHLGLYLDDELACVVSLFERNGSLQFRKFATRTHLQGKGYGTRLLLQVFADARKAGIAEIWCNARTSAAGFYERFGMHAFGATWTDLGHVFVKMKIEL